MGPFWQSIEWNFDLTGFLVGILFGAALFLSGLANPDKIIGTLRLKDLHALRVILLFVLVGMLGVWLLLLTGLVGEEHMSIKPLTMATVVLGGVVLGLGFGMTGFCPGTGLAATASGRLDALVTVLGMFGGAWLYVWLYPTVIGPMEVVGNYGKETIPDAYNLNVNWLVPAIFVVGVILLILTAPRKPKAAARPTRVGPGRKPEEGPEGRQDRVPTPPAPAQPAPMPAEPASVRPGNVVIEPEEPQRQQEEPEATKTEAVEEDDVFRLKPLEPKTEAEPGPAGIETAEEVEREEEAGPGSEGKPAALRPLNEPAPEADGDEEEERSDTGGPFVLDLDENEEEPEEFRLADEESDESQREADEREEDLRRNPSITDRPHDEPEQPAP